MSKNKRKGGKIKARAAGLYYERKLELKRQLLEMTRKPKNPAS